MKLGVVEIQPVLIWTILVCDSYNIVLQYADLLTHLGYFSVSVLERALEVWGLSLIRWRSEAMREYQSNPEEQLGFVLNLESHWFTIRGFTNGYW